MKTIKSLACIKNFRPKPLTEDSHQALQKALKHFQLKDSHLIYHHHFPAPFYIQTLEKMNRIGLIADEMDHHPEWTLQPTTLKIGLSTHEIGGEVSLKDYILGYWIEEILNEKNMEEELIAKWNNLDITYD